MCPGSSSSWPSVAFLTWLILQHTRLGRNIYALGSNPDAARLRGVPVKRVTFFTYAFTGALSGFAGLLYASRFGFLNPGQTGVGLELTVIAACRDRRRERVWRLRQRAGRAAGLPAAGRNQRGAWPCWASPAPGSWLCTG